MRANKTNERADKTNEHIKRGAAFLSTSSEERDTR